MAPSNLPSCVPEAAWKMLEIMVLRDGSSGQLTWPIFKGQLKSNSVNSKVVRSGMTLYVYILQYGIILYKQRVPGSY